MIFVKKQKQNKKLFFSKTLSRPCIREKLFEFNFFCIDFKCKNSTKNTIVRVFAKTFVSLTFCVSFLNVKIQQKIQ
jgi:hypothetical protein